jgi:hypothetical protein
MKIRLDYVSNSSSSSYVILGERVTGGLDAAKFDSLKKGEEFLVTVRGIGPEGDYVWAVPPDLLMDCDMHQIDFSKLEVYKARYAIGESGYLNPVKDVFKEDNSDNEYDWKETKEQKKIRKAMEGEGVDASGYRMFSVNRDYACPHDRYEIIRILENQMR